MRAPLRLLAVALALAVGLVVAVPPARAVMDKPTWMKDDYWDYSFTGTFATGSLLNIQGPGTLRVSVLGTEDVTVGGSTYSTYHTRLTVTASGAVIFNSGERWYRTSDLALVKAAINLTLDTILFGRVTVVTTSTYAPPLALTWPLGAAATWTSTGNLTTVSQIIGGGPLPPITLNLDTQFTVLSDTQVTVAAGAFDTTPVREEGNLGGQRDRYWAPGAGNSAREEERDGGGSTTYAAELREYRYQAPGYFLGVPIIAWLLVILLVVIIAVALFMRNRQRRGVVLPPGPPPR